MKTIVYQKQKANAHAKNHSLYRIGRPQGNHRPGHSAGAVAILPAMEAGHLGETESE
jgi:hypothetical protein